MRAAGLRRVAIGTVMLCAAPPALAGDHHYYNKSGVTREAYMADVAECAELAGGARVKDSYTPYSPNMIAAGVNAFFGGMMRSAERRRLRNSIERTCMADKGYARMAADDALVDAIEKIKGEEARLDRLFALASAAEPSGRRMKE